MTLKKDTRSKSATDLRSPKVLYESQYPLLLHSFSSTSICRNINMNFGERPFSVSHRWLTPEAKARDLEMTVQTVAVTQIPFKISAAPYPENTNRQCSQRDSHCTRHQVLDRAQILRSSKTG